MKIMQQWFANHFRGWLAWTLVIAGTCLLYTSMFHTVANMKEDAIKSMPKAMQDAFNLSDISTGPNYVQGTITGFLGLILVSIAAISWAAGAVAGDEESGDLALTLAHGVGRGRLYLWRLVAVVLAALVVCLAIALGILVMNPSQGLGISTVNAFIGTLAMLALVLLSASTAGAIGAITGRKSWAIGAGAFVLVASWVLNSLGGQAGLDWMRQLSPLHWAFHTEPLKNGGGWGAMAILLGCSLALWLAGATVFARRDING